MSGVDFGWGSAGKISAIMDVIGEPVNVVLLGTRLGRQVIAELPVTIDFPDWPLDEISLPDLLAAHHIDAALIVLDPQLATAIQEAGIPVVYVDSLPFMWSSADIIPTTVYRYCAQLLPGQHRERTPALESIHNLAWVEPIIKKGEGNAPVRHREGVAVVNFGGLHSPVNLSGNPTYLGLVLPPLLNALRKAGYRELHVVGNITRDDLYGRVLPEDIASVGPCTHEAFLDLVATAEVLVTSPGLTTVLEATQIGTRIVCLPAQNLSQLLNGDYFARTLVRDACVQWPNGVLDRAAVERARTKWGEEAALAVINSALSATETSVVHRALSSSIQLALSSTTCSAPGLGSTNGAQQVASHLVEAARLRKV